MSLRVLSPETHVHAKFWMQFHQVPVGPEAHPQMSSGSMNSSFCAEVQHFNVAYTCMLAFCKLNTSRLLSPRPVPQTPASPPRSCEPCGSVHTPSTCLQPLSLLSLLWECHFYQTHPHSWLQYPFSRRPCQARSSSVPSQGASPIQAPTRSLSISPSSSLHLVVQFCSLPRYSLACCL